MAKNNKKQQLTQKQLNAIDLFVLGKNDREVAEVIGANRSTVNQWKNHNPVFQAELNRRRKDIWEMATDEMRSLLSDALKTVKEAVRQGDAKTALEILKMAGLDMRNVNDNLGNYGIGYLSPENITNEKEYISSIDKMLEDLLK